MDARVILTNKKHINRIICDSYNALHTVSSALHTNTIPWGGINLLFCCFCSSQSPTMLMAFGWILLNQVCLLCLSQSSVAVAVAVAGVSSFIAHCRSSSLGGIIWSWRRSSPICFWMEICCLILALVLIWIMQHKLLEWFSGNL